MKSAPPALQSSPLVTLNAGDRLMKGKCMTKQTNKFFAQRRGLPGHTTNGTAGPAYERGRLLRLATLLLIVVSMATGYAVAQPRPKPQPKIVEQPGSHGKVSALELKHREVWRKSMARGQRPKKGCFVASYPQTTWKEVPCVT